MTTVPTFCFVIPCFNEENNVELTVGSVREAMGSRGDYEVVLVNDASTDRTLERMQALAAVDPCIRVLDNPSNLGFGGSYKRGARAATATYVMMLPGDDGFPAQSIAEIVSHAGAPFSSVTTYCGASKLRPTALPIKRKRWSN
jgi:glycosyltransferase involved in cell wall biosynthesis